MASYLETARQQWEEGDRRLTAEPRDPDAYETLMAQVEAVTEALRRRIGEHFTPRAARRRLRRAPTAGCTRRSPSERDGPGGPRRCRSLRTRRSIGTRGARPTTRHEHRRAPVRRRRRRGAGVVGWLIRIAAVVIVFGIGVAVGQALEDRPEPATAGDELPNDPALDADEPRDRDAHRDGHVPGAHARAKKVQLCLDSAGGRGRGQGAQAAAWK